MGLAGCASSGVKVDDADQFVVVIYGKVIATSEIEFESEVGKSAALGAIDGAIDQAHGDAGDVVAGAIFEAAISALVTSVEEGSNKGLLVDVVTPEHETMSLSLKTRKIRVGDCLRLISGNQVSYHLVDPQFCNSKPEA